MHLQAQVGQRAWEIGGGNLKAPAQRLTDFMKHKVSDRLPVSSYHPGTTSADLREVLPDFVHATLINGFKAFDCKMRRYIHEEAVVHATESRTSSPVRIPRDSSTLEHPQVPGLYPAGEGAGYAGGIVSAAMDGMRIARVIATEKSNSK